MGLWGLFRGNVETISLREDIKILQKANEGLKKEKITLKEELEELKLKKRLEQEEIKHLQKINEEKIKQELESKKLELARKYADDISRFKEEQRVVLVNSLREFHKKMEKRSDEEINRIKDMYQSIMGIMPKVNLMLEKKVR